MSKFMLPLIFCGLAVFQTVRVDALADESEVPATATNALQALPCPPQTLDSEGGVVEPNPVRTAGSAVLKSKPKMPEGATVVELIRNLDVRPESIMVSLLIAETSDQEVTAEYMKSCPKELIPCVREHGRLEVLSRPQVMTLNNQSGTVILGGAKDRALHALNVSVTPTIRKDGNIDIELVVGRSKTVSKDDGNWIKDGFSSRRRVSARSAETVIVSGLRTTANENDAKLVIAMTPYLTSSDEAGDAATR